MVSKPYENERPKPDRPSKQQMQSMLASISANLRRGDIRKAQGYAVDLAKALHFMGLLPDTLELGE
jgi:hypothetical protein